MRDGQSARLPETKTGDVRLALHDDYCRQRLLIPILMGAAAVGLTAFLLFAMGFRGRSVVLMVPTLTAGLLMLGLMSSIDLRPRVRILRHLIEKGVPTPAVFIDTQWSHDWESPWGESVWTYASDGRNFQVRALEHAAVKIRTEATALFDPEHPERAVLVMPNGMTRGGYRLSGGWDVRRVLLVLLFAATWGLWVVTIGIAFS